MINVNATDSVCLTFDERGALLTARGKDHDLDADALATLRDACNAALIMQNQPRTYNASEVRRWLRERADAVAAARQKSLIDCGLVARVDPDEALRDAADDFR